MPGTGRSRNAGTIAGMAVLRQQDLDKGRTAYAQWRDAAKAALQALAGGTDGSPDCDANGSGIANGSTTRTAAGGTAIAEVSSGIPNVPTAARLALKPDLPRPVWAMAVRFSLFMLERRAPGEGVEVRVAPWGAIKILEGPASDPHNLTPPDVIELEPDVWLRLATGVTSWAEEKDAGRISAVGERDDLSDLLPL